MVIGNGSRLGCFYECLSNGSDSPKARTGAFDCATRCGIVRGRRPACAGNPGEGLPSASGRSSTASIVCSHPGRRRFASRPFSHHAVGARRSPASSSQYGKFLPRIVGAQSCIVFAKRRWVMPLVSRWPNLALQVRPQPKSRNAQTSFRLRAFSESTSVGGENVASGDDPDQL